MAFNFRKSFGWNKQQGNSTSNNPRWSGRRDNPSTPTTPSNPTFSPFGRSFGKSTPTPPTMPPQPKPPSSNNTFGGGWNSPSNPFNKGSAVTPSYTPFGNSGSKPPPSSPSFGGAKEAGTTKVVGQPGLPVANISPRVPVNARRNKVLALISLIFGIGAIVGVFAIAASLPPPPPQGIQLFPVETRSGNDYIGIFFLEPKPDEEAGAAFISAARRWSEILRGSERLFPNTLVTQACGRTFPEPIRLDHLRIFSTIAPQAVGGRLASAGFCQLINNQQTASFGNMDFDALDIPGLVEREQLEAVVLHEMGHVLGIGTLWGRFNIIINALPGGEPDLTRAQPEYTGAQGILGFSQIGGQGPLFIENGFTNDRDNGARAGSTNAHFDQDAAVNELMTFQISFRGSPLSLLTARSLIDLGLTVDLSRVDQFNLNSVVSETPESEDSQGDISLYDDIIEYEFEDL